MSVQASINNMLSVAGVLASMNPEIRARAENRAEVSKLNAREKALQEQYRQASGKVEDVENLSKISAENLLDADELGATKFTSLPDTKTTSRIEDDLTDLYAQKFDLSPSAETYSAKLAAEYGQYPGLDKEQERVGVFRKHLEAKEAEKAVEEAKRKAEEQLMLKQAEKRSSRRFMDYLKDEPTSLGVNVGALSKSAQKEIAKNYTKAEKTRIMNTKDLERKQNG